jgi:hypothetical protein
MATENQRLAYRKAIEPHIAAFKAAKAREAALMQERLKPALDALNSARQTLRAKHGLPPAEPYTRG